ncbi:hypothetical protein [Moorella sp. ACPs]|uniref:hypothetical protein n=1 Tax=Neomoorella carbonis TaxID=3062783 RepID=UPI003248E882
MTLPPNFDQSIFWHHEQIGARVTEALKSTTAMEAREQVLNFNLPDKSCRVTAIIEMCPRGNREFYIVLVGEEYGY